MTSPVQPPTLYTQPAPTSTPARTPCPPHYDETTMFSATSPLTPTGWSSLARASSYYVDLQIHAQDASVLRLAPQSLLRHCKGLTYPPFCPQFVKEGLFVRGASNKCMYVGFYRGPELTAFTLIERSRCTPLSFLLEPVVHQSSSLLSEYSWFRISNAARQQERRAYGQVNELAVRRRIMNVADEITFLYKDYLDIYIASSSQSRTQTGILRAI